MKDLIDDLIDMHHQATKERSHYYTGALLKRAIEEIIRLRTIIQQLSKSL